jgi:hypothetical protein
VAGWLRATGRWSPAEAAATVRLARVVSAATEVGKSLVEGNLGLGCWLGRSPTPAAESSCPRCFRS